MSTYLYYVYIKYLYITYKFDSLITEKPIFIFFFTLIHLHGTSHKNRFFPVTFIIWICIIIIFNLFPLLKHNVCTSFHRKYVWFFVIAPFSHNHNVMEKKKKVNLNGDYLCSKEKHPSNSAISLFSPLCPGTLQLQN